MKDLDSYFKKEAIRLGYDLGVFIMVEDNDEDTE
jgi:hypothetical protein